MWGPKGSPWGASIPPGTGPHRRSQAEGAGRPAAGGGGRAPPPGSGAGGAGQGPPCRAALGGRKGAASACLCGPDGPWETLELKLPQTESSFRYMGSGVGSFKLKSLQERTAKDQGERVTDCPSVHLQAHSYSDLILRYFVHKTRISAVCVCV